MKDSSQSSLVAELLTVHEVAAATRRSPGAIYVERHRGNGIGALGVVVGRKLMWRRSDIDRWFDDQLRGGAA